MNDARSTENNANFNVVPIPRTEGGKFAKGAPGRLPGTRNRISAAAIAAVKDMSDTAIQQLRIKLEKGDFDAIVYVLKSHNRSPLINLVSAIWLVIFHETSICKGFRG